MVVQVSTCQSAIEGSSTSSSKQELHFDYQQNCAQPKYHNEKLAHGKS